MPRRMGRPGLVGTMARTAVIAGTASAVAGSVAQGQQAKAQGAAAQQQAAIDQAVANQLAAQPAAAPAPAAAADPLMAELQRLAEMKQQGLISEEEFTAMKARLLGL
jgi:hypothetical protein